MKLNIIQTIIRSKSVITVDKYLKILKIFKIIIIIILCGLYLKNILNLKNRCSILKKIKDYEKFNNINNNYINEFRRINSNNILLDKKKYERTNNPDITVILIMFNQAYCIHKALRSIQNQSIKNLEIIIIDDCSSDDSIEIIKTYQKEDDRIILIEHKINQGKIKSRSDGIRMAKGKYITMIDGDDSLTHKDIIRNSLYIAKLGDLDIVEFKIIKYRNDKYIGYHNKYPIITDNIIYQPELRTKFFYISDNYRYRAIQNRNICGKIIKTEILRKVINNIGPKYSEDYIIDYEDTIMVVSLFQVSKSYYFMKQNGYYYSKDKKKKTKLKVCKCKTINSIRGMDQVKLLQFLIEKTKNNKIEKQLIYHEIISINYYTNFYRFINHDFKMVYDILDKIVKSRFLTKNQKRIIILIKYILKEKEKKLNLKI